MNATATPPAAPTTPAARKPVEISPMIGGGQKELTADDLRARTFTVRCNVECKTDEKEVTACVPLYEVPLLQRRYRDNGGEARVTATWLPAVHKHPRVVPLNMDMLRDEIARLEGSYRVFLQNGGVKSLFKEIYGRDGDPIKGFYQVINKQVRAWRELEAKLKGGHRLQADDLQAIVDIASPRTEFDAPDLIEDVRDGTIDTSALRAPEDDILPEDPLADLQEFLGQKGWDIEIIMDVCKAVGDGTGITKVSIGALPSMHGKRSDCQRLMTDFKTWMKVTEKKAEQRAASKAAKEHIGELNA